VTGAGRAAGPRVGLFGGLGSGNIGNDASLEAVLGYLSTEHPDAVLDAMCSGPQRVTERYGLPASYAQWFQNYEQRVSGVRAMLFKVLGKGIDVFRTAAWVRRHDVVIVPGMGVLETSLPVRPWQFPFTMFVLCASGKIVRTKVALVSIGTSVTSKRLTRRLLVWAARLAFYRSYRDAMSRDAMRVQGLDTTRDHVFTDLVFGTPVRSDDSGEVRTVGVGVMDYYGSNDDERAHADEIRAFYVEKMKLFVRWLVDGGRNVRLLVGDANGSDETVVKEILADIRECRPALEPGRVSAPSASTFGELARAMAPASTVVASRYHNVICALMLGKPLISIGYSEKNTALMENMGLSQFCQFVSSLDTGRLIEQFTTLESQAAPLRQAIMDRAAANEQLVRLQFAELSAALFPVTAAEHADAERAGVNAAPGRDAGEGRDGC
jgi:polysaccharide pyruvyl transferase WcaK-like protein